MYKIFGATKDTYITNKVISNESRVSSSAGFSSTLDLFKLYGASTYLSGGVNYPNTELSRILLGFDISDIKDLYDSGKIDIENSKFNCTLHLFDVYGGQPTPANFNVVVSPLSRSFDEGRGKDIVYYTDLDVANFLSTSFAEGSWYASGASAGGDLTTVGLYDFFTSISGSSIESRQFFESGEEDLVVDVTKIVSASLVGMLQGLNLRISFDSSEESDNKTYFVKRFAARHAHDVSKRPRLILSYPDAILDTSATMEFNVSGSLFLYNNTANGMANLLSSSLAITGSNCVLLNLVTNQVSGGLSLFYTGSQFKIGTTGEAGTYYASVNVSMNDQFISVLATSGSVSFTPIWKSLDGTITYATGSIVKFKGSNATSTPSNKKKYSITAYGIPTQMTYGDTTLVRVNVFDSSDPLLKTVRIPVETVNKVPRESYYSVRDADTSETIVPFDRVKQSTLMSTDSSGAYFTLNTSSLLKNRSYVIDIMIVESNDVAIYKNVSVVFRVV